MLRHAGWAAIRAGLPSGRSGKVRSDSGSPSVARAVGAPSGTGGPEQVYNGSWQAIALGRSTSSSTTWPPTKRKPSAHSWSIIRRCGCTSRRPIRRGSTTSSFGFRRSRWFRWRDTNDAVQYVGDPAEVDAISHHNRIHLAIVELMSFPTGPSVHNEKASALTIVKLRDTSPEAVIASFGDEEKIRESLGTLPAEVSRPLPTITASGERTNGPAKANNMNGILWLLMWVDEVTAGDIRRTNGTNTLQVIRRSTVMTSHYPLRVRIALSWLGGRD